MVTAGAGVFGVVDFEDGCREIDFSICRVNGVEGENFSPKDFSLEHKPSD